MALDDGEVRQNELRRQLATLSLACLRPSGPAEAVQAAVWWNLLARLGLRLPLCAVHDLGLLLARRELGPPQIVRPAVAGPALGPRRPPPVSVPA